MVRDLEGLVEFFGRALLLGFRGWRRLSICRVLVSRMEIEKRFAMTKAYQDSIVRQ